MVLSFQVKHTCHPNMRTEQLQEVADTIFQPHDDITVAYKNQARVRSFKKTKSPCRMSCTGCHEKKIRAGRKPSSVPRSPGAVIIYLGPRLLEGTSGLPGSLGRAVLIPLREALPYAILLQAGFSKHSGHPGVWWALTPPFHPCLLRGGLLFCGTLHGVAPCPVSGPPCPAELGLSSPRCRGAIT